MVFLDLIKSYDNLYQGRILKTLEGCGMGSNIQGMLVEFWEQQEVVTQKNGYHGTQFRATCGTTHGFLTFPTLFNVAVDNLVRHWLYMTVEDDALIIDGLGHAVGRSAGYYTHTMA